MADIPVPEQIPLTNVVVASAGQTVFAYDFRADEVGDMRANYYRADGSVLAFVGGVDFTVSGIGNPAGGTITLTAIADTATGETMAIYRSVIIDRLTDFQRDLLSSSLNLEFDKAFMIMQELRRDVDASLRFPPGVDYSPLPFPDDKKVIAWEGRQLVNVSPSEFIADAGFATAAQGEKADTALQPGTGVYRIPSFAGAAGVAVPAGVVRVFVDDVQSHFVAYAGSTSGLSSNVVLTTAGGAKWIRDQDTVEQGIFSLRDFLTPRARHLIEQYNVTLQNPSENVTAFRSMVDTATAWLFAGPAGNKRAVRFNLPQGEIAIDDELFSDDFVAKVWAANWPSGETRFSFCGDGEGCVFVVKGWKTLASVRATGRWAGKLVTQAIFRWEQPGPYPPLGPDMRNIKFRGTFVPGQDPMALWMSNLNKSFLKNIEINSIANHPYFLERVENSAWDDFTVLFSGYQPSLCGGDGYIPEASKYNVTGTALTRASGSFEFTAAHVGLEIWIANAGRNGGAWVTTISAYNSPTSVTLADPVIQNLTNRAISFGALKGSFSTANPKRLVLLRDAPGANIYPGQLVVLPFARDSNEERVQFNFITAKSGVDIDLMYDVQTTKTNVPVVLGAIGLIGRFDDSATLGSNDFHIRRAWHEYSYIKGSCFGAIIQQAFNVFIDGKFHLNAQDYNGFATGEVGLWLDGVNGQSMFARGVEMGWSGFSTEYGRIAVTGDNTNIDLRGVQNGQFQEANRAALVYWAPKTAGKSGLLWMNTSFNRYWPVDGQTNFRMGGAGSALDIEEISREYRADQGLVSRAVSWTPSIEFNVPGSPTISYTTRLGSYVRNGDMITAQFRLQFSVTSKGGAAGFLYVSGLPFKAAGSPLSIWPGVLSAFILPTATTFTGEINLMMDANQTRAYATNSKAGDSAIGFLNAGQISEGETLILTGSITYKAAR